MTKKVILKIYKKGVNGIINEIFVTFVIIFCSKMDNRLLKILEEETAKEKSKKKKKPAFSLRKEKSLNYYSGWHKGKPLEKESKEEKQTTLK